MCVVHVVFMFCSHRAQWSQPGARKPNNEPAAKRQRAEVDGTSISRPVDRVDDEDEIPSEVRQRLDALKGGTIKTVD